MGNVSTLPAEAGRESASAVLERAIVLGDLSKLTPAERVQHYREVCESMGLNPLTRPFEYLVLNGRLTLYATRGCADQLRRLHGVSIEIVSQQQVGDLYVVHVRARTRDGRQDEEIGAVPTVGLRGEALANAILKAITKAKRRVTLSICGLGWLDESEVDSIPEARVVAVDATTGEIQGELPEPAQGAPEPSVPDTALEHIARLLREHGVKPKQLCEALNIAEPDRTRWREQVREVMEAEGLSLNDIRLLIEGLAGEVDGPLDNSVYSVYATG